MTRGDRRIPDALLERYLADALAPGEHERLSQVLAQSEPDRTQLEALRADSAAFLIQHPPGPLVAKVEAARGKSWRGRWALLAAPLFAAGALATVLLVVRPVEEPEYTTKGALSLSVHVKQGNGSVKLAPREPLQAQAAVRFEVRAPKVGFVAVLSRDGRGKVTVYHPYDGREAEPYDPRSPLLSTAIELDGAHVRETLYALFSEERFPLGWAVKALAQGKDLRGGSAPEGISVAVFELGGDAAR